MEINLRGWAEMKNAFSEYYPPNAEQYEVLWKEGLIVLDTNVLLNLYRLPAAARDELLEVLELLKERLWIPHQVALEFQRRRLTVISAERKLTEDALSSARVHIEELRSKVDGLQIDKRGIGVESEPLMADLERANARLLDAIDAAHKKQLDIAAADPIRERLDVILAGRVGAGPGAQADLDALVQDGEDRFREKIPPGFADADKEKNPNEATFIHDHLKYQRKFGDLILWRQLIQHAKTSGTKAVLLVTADRKEDWWWREQGKIIGAHPELVREICRDGSVELFWMYSSVQFMEYAPRYTTAKVSSESVAELEQVVSAEPSLGKGLMRLVENPVFSEKLGSQAMAHHRWLEGRSYGIALEEAVGFWLSQIHGVVQRNAPNGFPDFLVTREGEVHGYEVKFLRNLGNEIGPALVNTFLRGHIAMTSGRLDDFTLIIGTTEDQFFSAVRGDGAFALRRRIDRLLTDYPISEVVIGAVIEDRFEVLDTKFPGGFDKFGSQ